MEHREGQSMDMSYPHHEGEQSQSLEQTLTRLSHTINGTEDSESSNPLNLWAEGKKRGEEFRRDYETKAIQRSEIERVNSLIKLSEWIEKDEQSARPVLTQVADACVKLWDKVESSGHPGHDKRHVREDLKAALSSVHDSLQTGSSIGASLQKVGLIGSMMHDFGRLPEAKATGEVAGSEAGREHPKVSYLILDEILKHFPDIPEDLRDSLNYAVVVHQDWVSDPTAPNYKVIMEDPIARSVASADRRQLLGENGLTRFLQFDIGMGDREIAASPLESWKTILNPRQKDPSLPLPIHAEYYMRTHRPVDLPLFSTESTIDGSIISVLKEENAALVRSNERVNQQTRELEAVTGVALWLGWPNLREAIFAPELEVEKKEKEEVGSGEAWRSENEELYRKNEKNFLSRQTWKKIRDQIQEASTDGTPLYTKIRKKLEGKTLEDLAREIVTAKEAAIEGGELKTIARKLTSVTDKETRESLSSAFAYLLVMRDEFEDQSQRNLQKIQTDTDLFLEQGIVQKFVDFLSRKPTT